jgi:futalosine hydrolase
MMNILITAATSMEMQAYVDACNGDYSRARGKPVRQERVEISHLVTGIGLVETTLTLTSALQKNNAIDCVINFGIAGAYLKNCTSIQAGLLDICLADQEILGDFGIQLADKVEKFGDDLPVRDNFVLDPGLLSAAGQILEDGGISYKVGTFVTVNCASGTLYRGNQLGRQFRGLCENMEGAAVARVCEEFSLPCLEVRCISNMVEDRNRESWRIKEACVKVGRAAAVIAMGFASPPHSAPLTISRI